MRIAILTANTEIYREQEEDVYKRQITGQDLIGQLKGKALGEKW